MKVDKIILIVAVCALLIGGAFGVVLWPAGGVAQAVGPMQSPLPTPRPTSRPPSPPGYRVCVARFTANIRSGPGTHYRKVGTLRAWYRFYRTRRSGNWSYGSSVFGRGWVYTPLLRC